MVNRSAGMIEIRIYPLLFFLKNDHAFLDPGAGSRGIQRQEGKKEAERD
jgi:hypothetical protein